MRIVDARGQACPQPVILTRRALDEADELLVIVDNDTAEMNVSRMAENDSCRVEVEHRDDGAYLHIVKTGVEPLEQVLSTH
jgi:tRNA 2-thiouridine synthesizing protein A